jgi:ODP family beta lactamase
MNGGYNMNTPEMFSSQRVSSDTDALVSYYPLPGAGILPVNSFLIRGEQPLLVDTGVAALREEFLSSLGSLMDLRDLRWIWLTHIDADHVGNLPAVLKEAPDATIITTFLGLGKLGLLQIPAERVYLLNPGQRLNLGDRELMAVRPPCFDAPETTGFLDMRTGSLFSSDCFGALLREPAESAESIPENALQEGLIGWAVVDSPWLHNVDPMLFGASLSEYKKLSPSVLLSSHLPPATAMLDVLCRHLSNARAAPRFTGPDQSAFQQMMALAG